MVKIQLTHVYGVMFAINGTGVVTEMARTAKDFLTGSVNVVKSGLVGYPFSDQVYEGARTIKNMVGSIMLVTGWLLRV